MRMAVGTYPAIAGHCSQINSTRKSRPRTNCPHAEKPGRPCSARADRRTILCGGHRRAGRIAPHHVTAEKLEAYGAIRGAPRDKSLLGWQEVQRFFCRSGEAAAVEAPKQVGYRAR